MLYVIRHGQTDWNVEGKTQGSIDIKLNETGKKQAEKVKRVSNVIEKIQRPKK